MLRVSFPLGRADGRRLPAGWGLVPFAALFIFALAAAAQAQTIVPNPYLNAQLPPWTAYLSAAPDDVGAGFAPVWTAAPDVNGSAASGSARIALSSGVSGNAASGMRQCVDFSAPTSVSFFNYGMSFQVPPLTPLDGSVRATVEVRLFSGAGCNGFISGATQGQLLTAAGVSASNWYRLSDNSFVPMDAPVMAASAEVRGYLRRAAAPQTLEGATASLDYFVLVLNSTTPVELLHFDID